MTNPFTFDWRDIGDTTLDVYQKEFERVNSPMLSEVAAVYEAAKPHSAQILAHMWKENQYATTGIVIKPEHHNPLGLVARYGEPRIPFPQEPSMDNRFAIYPTWVDCINAWKRRVEDPQMPYVVTITLEEFLAVYAPSGDKHPITGLDNADINYLGTMEAMLRRFAMMEGQQMPNIIDMWLHVAQSGWPAVERRYIGRFGAQPKIIVLHIQQGTNWGSWQHFHNVSASATVEIGKNGDIWRLVPESDAPWTNGDVNNPSALGREVINKWGSDPNIYSLTIETEGMSGEAAPQAQIDSIVWQISTWMQKYNIPLRYVLRHADINSVDKAFCPGNALYNTVISRLSNVPVYVQPDPVQLDGQLWDGTSNITIGQKTFFADKRTVKVASNGLAVRKYADPQSAETRAPLTSGQTFPVFGWVRGSAVDSEDRWWVTETYSRVWVGGTVEKPATPTTTTTTPPLPTPTTTTTPPPEVSPVIQNEKAYYRAKRTVNVVRDANLRSLASLESAIVGAVHKGDTVDVAYWYVGDTVRGESLWWILDQGSDPIKDGPRLWMAATTEKPQ